MLSRGQAAARPVASEEDAWRRPMARRSFVHFGVAGLSVGAVRVAGHGAGRNGSGDARRQATERLVRRLMHAVESGSTSAIWSFFGDDGVIEFPFLGDRYTDFSSFDAAIGPALAVLEGLTFTEPVFEALADPEALIAKFKGHAVVTFTGKPYDQTYIVEVHTRRGQVSSWSEYFDTAVLNEAFTP